MSKTTAQYLLGTVVGSVALGGAMRFKDATVFLWLAFVMLVGAVISANISPE